MIILHSKSESRPLFIVFPSCIVWSQPLRYLKRWSDDGKTGDSLQDTGNVWSNEFDFLNVTKSSIISGEYGNSEIGALAKV